MKKSKYILSIVVLSCALCGCSKEEALGYYNHALQFMGEFQLTGDFSLEGKRNYGVDHYTGEYAAEYRNFSKTEYIFGGTTIERKYGKEVTVFCSLEISEGTAEVFLASGSEEPVVLLNEDGKYAETLTLPEGGNYIGIAGERFTGKAELVIE